MFVILFSALLSYFSCYGSECDNAIKFISNNKSEFKRGLSKHSTTEQLMAMSIIAPELSQFSNVFNVI